MDEKRIIHLARSGDPDAFCQLYDQYKDRLYRYAFYRLGSRQDAEDAVSECVLSAYRQIKNLKNAEAFPAWIFRILSAVCGRQIARQIEDRKNRFEPGENRFAPGGSSDENGPGTMDPLDRIPASGPDADPAETVALQVDLQRALDQLSAEEKEIVLLSLVAGFSSKEIAQMTGSRPGTVRAKQSRSLAKMRILLEERA